MKKLLVLSFISLQFFGISANALMKPWCCEDAEKVRGPLSSMLRSPGLDLVLDDYAKKMIVAFNKREDLNDAGHRVFSELTASISSGVNESRKVFTKEMGEKAFINLIVHRPITLLCGDGMYYMPCQFMADECYKSSKENTFSRYRLYAALSLGLGVAGYRAAQYLANNQNLYVPLAAGAAIGALPGIIGGCRKYLDVRYLDKADAWIKNKKGCNKFLPEKSTGCNVALNPGLTESERKEIVEAGYGGNAYSPIRVYPCYNSNSDILPQSNNFIGWKKINGCDIQADSDFGPFIDSWDPNELVQVNIENKKDLSECLPSNGLTFNKQEWDKDRSLLLSNASKDVYRIFFEKSDPESQPNLMVVRKQEASANGRGAEDNWISFLKK